MNEVKHRLEAIHDFLLLNPSSDNEIQVTEILKNEIGFARTVFFIYYSYLVNDLRILAKQEEHELAKYIDNLHKQVEFEVYPNPFEFVNMIDTDSSISSSTTNTTHIRYKCIRCVSSYATLDGVRKHYTDKHGKVTAGPCSYCVTIR